MNIQLENIGRRFNKEWIFKNIDFTFSNNNAYAILGSNGSGKSTFLQLLSGYLIPSEGQLHYKFQNQTIKQEQYYKHFSFCSPFLELYDEMTINEAFQFQAGLKPFQKGISITEFNQLLQLENTKDKAIKNFSSGMKQRVKLALAVLCDTPVLFLDEPCTNLDADAIQWYQTLVKDFKNDRLIFVSSNNQKEELFICNQEFRIEHYK